MKIACFRCGKELDSPDASNADYVVASDTVVREPRDILIAVKYNQATLAKKAKMLETMPVLDGEGVEIGREYKYPDLAITESEYDRVEVSSIRDAEKNIGEDLVRVIAEVEDKDIQKTGIICPDCYKSTDFLIWGIHK